MVDLAAGEARPMSADAFETTAEDIGCEPAVVQAIWTVEAAGKGFFKDGRLKILCEKHVFHKYLPKGKREKALDLGLARKKWVRGGYNDQKSAGQRYKIWQRMIEFSEGPGWMSVSMGGGQIMGFNAEKAGYANARDMFLSFRDSEDEHLEGFINLIRSFGLTEAMREKDWRKIALKYNGSGQVDHYAKAMERAYLKASKGAPVSVPPKPAPEPTKPKPEPVRPTGPMKRPTNLVDWFRSFFN